MDESRLSQINPKILRLRSLKLSLQIHSSTFLWPVLAIKCQPGKEQAPGFLVVQEGVVMGN